MAAPRRPRGALYTARGKRVTKLSLARAEKAGKSIREARTAAGKPILGKALERRIEAIKMGRPARTRARLAPEPVLERGASGYRDVVPWTRVQQRRVALWQYAVEQGRQSGDYGRTFDNILGVEPGGRYTVFVDEGGERRPVNLETDPAALRDFDDAGALFSVGRRGYPRTPRAEAAE
jgi:hypothetical protein